MLIVVKFSHQVILFASSTELFSRPDYITLHVHEQVFALYSLVLSHPSSRPFVVRCKLFLFFRSLACKGVSPGWGGLEASDPLQFIPPPTLTLRMGDFLLVYVKNTGKDLHFFFIYVKAGVHLPV